MADFAIVCKILVTVILSLLVQTQTQVVFKQNVAKPHTVKRQVVTPKTIMCFYNPYDKPYSLESGRYAPENMDPHLCSHIVYVSAKPSKALGIEPSDKYQDIDLGGYRRTNALKNQNPRLKTMISLNAVGEDSQLLARVIAQRDQRLELVKNITKFVKQYEWDGVILIWIWPQSADKVTLVTFLKDLSEEFERTAAASNTSRYLIGIGLPCGVDDIEKGYDLTSLNKYVDYIMVLSFDFNYFHQRNTAQISPLYSLTDVENDRYTVDYVMKYTVGKGAEPKKVLLGVPTSGNSYKLDNPRDTSIGSPAVENTWEKALLSHTEICETIKLDKRWVVVTQKNGRAGPYAFRDNEWISYDNPEMIAKKAKYVIEKGFNGIVFANLASDDPTGTCYGKKYPLISSAKAVFSNNGTGSSTTATSRPIKPTDFENKNANGCKLPGKSRFHLEYELSCSEDDIAQDCKNTPEGSVAPQYTSLTLSCQQGYVYDAYQELSTICVKSKWIPAITPCKKLCKQLNPVNVNLRCVHKGKNVNCTQDLQPGTIVYPRCKPGYRATNVPDYDTITCQDNGEWDDILFKCAPVCGHVSVSLTPLIHGGRDAKYGEFPWHAAIYDKNRNNELICAGTIISPYLVISAAHCFSEQVSGRMNNAEDYTIAVGKYDRNYSVSDSELTKIYKIKKIYFNDYHGLQYRYENDIAVLEMANKIEFSDVVIPACVYYQSSSTPELQSGQILKVAGWGLDEKGEATAILKIVGLPYLSTSDCLKRATAGIIDFLSRDKFCAGNNTNEEVDKGDSGGGLMYQDPETSLYYLYGIVSYKATQVSPVAVFTKVQNHVNWIKSLRDNIQKV